jgi:GNAT superfamily N-acetyltransferase
VSVRASLSDVQIRRATPEDAEVCGRIFYEAFATINRSHNFPPELPAPEAGIGILGMLFSHPGFYCVVAESGGRIVGSNCLDERSKIFGLGPVSVDPAVQNRGVGRTLMSAMLDRVRQKDGSGVRLLQATFHNRSLSLYAKLGFDAREPISVMQGQAPAATVEGCTVRPATSADLNRCNHLCEQVHGHDRAGELSDGISHGIALVVERHGRITGYASGFGYFGHAVAEATLDLQALIGAAKDVSGPGILVPTRNAELFRWCLENGLRVFQPMTLMTIGLYNQPTGAYLPSILY